MTLLSWACQLTVAVILGQTLFFKFTGAEESVYIFSTLGVEPWGRIATGVIELIAAVLVLIPRSAWLGALLAAGSMAGAILSHLTLLGIEVMGDGGLLFALAFAVLIAALVVLWLHRRDLPVLGAAF
jgi:uncharacterized membrane protein YphA (DoxX/SURF4 family)